MKYILGIQTAIFPNSIAVVSKDYKVSKSIEFKAREKTIENLRESLERILKGLKIHVEDIGIVSVCLGPGSYTGTRGGLSFAKGFCQFKDIPLTGISAFEAMSENVKNSKNVIYILDAGNERVFYTKKIGDYEKIKVDYSKDIPLKASDKFTIIGSGVADYKKIIKKEFGKVLKEVSLDAIDVAKKGAEKYKQNPSIYSKEYLLKVKPLYILPPNITKSSR